MTFDYDKNLLWHFLGDTMHVHVIEIMTKALHDFYALFSMHENKTANPS